MANIETSYQRFLIDISAAVDSREIARYGQQVTSFTVLGLTSAVVPTIRIGQRNPPLPLTFGMSWKPDIPGDAHIGGLYVDVPPGGNPGDELDIVVFFGRGATVEIV